MAPFEFKIVAPDEPMRDDPFWAYLETHAAKGCRISDMTHIKMYLATLGFVHGEHRISEEDMNTLKNIAHYWYETCPWTPPKRMDELFCDSGPHGLSFWLRKPEDARGCHTGITTLLIRLITESGWVYGVTPSTTYFEIIDDRLYAKYQSILGSRFICRLEGGLARP